MTEPTAPVRRDVILTAASLVIVIAGIRAAEAILIPLLVSVFLAILSMPVVGWLRRWVGGPLAVLIVVLGVVGALVGMGVLLGTSLAGFTESLPRYQSRLLVLAEQATEWLQGFGLEVTAASLREVVDPGAILGWVGGTLRGIAALLQNTLLVIVTLVFIMLEATAFPARIRAVMGRPDADLSYFSVVTHQVQRYLLIKTGTSLVTGLLLGIWVTVLDVDFPVLWGLVAFVLNYIPTLGSIIAAVPPVLLSLVQFGPGPAALVAVGYVAVNLSIGNFLDPHLMGRRLGMSTLVVFLSLVFWGWVWGPVGMLLSVPLTMIIKILLEHSEDWRWVSLLLESRSGLEDPFEPEATWPGRKRRPPGAA